MSGSDRHRWVARALVLGLVYAAVGIAFGVLAGHAASQQMRGVWRLGAWIASAAVYAAHVAYEHFRLRNAPRSTALHVGVAVAIGGLGLAVWATVHSLLSPVPDHRMRLFTLALVVWPLVTGLPAYLVAFLATAVLARR